MRNWKHHGFAKYVDCPICDAADVERLRPRLEPPPPGHPSLSGPSSPPRRTAPLFRSTAIDRIPAFRNRKDFLPFIACGSAVDVMRQPGARALKGPEIFQRSCRNVVPGSRYHSAQRMPRPKFQKGRGARLDAALQATCPLHRLRYLRGQLVEPGFSRDDRSAVYAAQDARAGGRRECRGYQAQALPKRRRGCCEPSGVGGHLDRQINDPRGVHRLRFIRRSPAAPRGLRRGRKHRRD